MASKIRLLLAIAVTATTSVVWLLNDDLSNMAQLSAQRLSGNSWRTSRPSDLVTDLIDPSVVVRTPGASLTDQEHGAFSKIGLIVPSYIAAGQTFNLTLQCDPDIIGDHHCAGQYHVHFRGPIAYSVPAAEAIYHHNATTGTTLVECQLPQSGVYEVWVWPDWHRLNGCPAETESYGAVKGSGETTFTIAEGPRPQIDAMRPCTRDDYDSPLTGRWVSVQHIREEYRWLPVMKSHLERSARLHGRSAMPDYIYLPYQCKRHALDYERSLHAIKDMKHVAYLGDSVLRSSYCGHLYSTLHNGSVGGDCSFSDEWAKYQKSDKTFKFGLETSGDSRGSIRFTQRFIDDHPENAADRIADIKQYGTDLTHVITNLGMWFGYRSQQDYIAAVYAHLERLYSFFGNNPRYTWVNTYSVSPPVICNGMMRRSVLRHHGEWASIAINAWRDRHPDVRMNVIHSHTVVDSRPETTSDGRHWVAEGGRPDPAVRPLVGAADDAVMEAVYDYWRLADEYDRQFAL